MQTFQGTVFNNWVRIKPDTYAGPALKPDTTPVRLKPDTTSVRLKPDTTYLPQQNGTPALHEGLKRRDAGLERVRAVQLPRVRLHVGRNQPLILLR
jgi:hypothetical protein